MPNTSSYFSKNVETGLVFDTLVGNLLTFRPSSWGYTEQEYENISIDFGVASNSLYYLEPGNYKLFNLPNSPFDTNFVNIFVYERSGAKVFICTIGGKEKFSCTLTDTADEIMWTDITNVDVLGNDITLMQIGNSAPSNTKLLWIDTSTGVPSLKHYNGAQWVSYTASGQMLTSVYDPEGRNADVYSTLAAELLRQTGRYELFIEHKNDRLTLIHILDSDREYYNTYLLTQEEVTAMFATDSELYAEMISFIKSCSIRETKYNENGVKIAGIKADFDSHVLSHITSDTIRIWNSKSSSDHNHNLDGKVIIRASDIKATSTVTTFPASQVSASACERIYKLSTFDVLGNAISDTDLENKYCDGNVLYTEDANGNREWRRIVDNTRFGTSDYMSGLVYLSSTYEIAKFDKLINTPSTCAEYGIIDNVNTAELAALEAELENIKHILFTPAGYTATDIGSNSLYLGVQKTLSTTGGGTPNYAMSTAHSDLDIIMTRDVSGDQYSTVDKFNCESGDTEYSESYVNMAYSEPGLSKVETDILASEYFSSLYSIDTDNPLWVSDGLGRMIKVNTSTNNTIIDATYAINNHTYTLKVLWNVAVGIIFDITVANAIYSISDISTNLLEQSDKLALATDARANVLHNMGAPIVVNQWEFLPQLANWSSVCYGNGKFVAVANNSNIAAYSSDGINWTQVKISNTVRNWTCSCYGGDKFVAIASGSNIVAYSANGSIWTETTIGSTARSWSSICYGNGKFIAVAIGANIFAHSSDGIIWTESIISTTSRNWSSVCYGNGMFVAVANITTAAAYSTNGTTWTEVTISSTARNWSSVCYGNGTFIAVSSGSTNIAYSTNGTTWTDQAISTLPLCNSICYGNGKFIAVANKYITYSVDGLSWINLDALENLKSICYNGSKFIAVGSSSTQGYAIIY